MSMIEPQSRYGPFGKKTSSCTSWKSSPGQCWLPCWNWPATGRYSTAVIFVTPLCCKIHINVILHFTSLSDKWFQLSGQKFMFVYHLPYSCYASCPLLLLFGHKVTLQTIKFFILQFFILLLLPPSMSRYSSPQPLVSVHIRHHVSHPYKTKGEVTVLDQVKWDTPFVWDRYWALEFFIFVITLFNYITSTTDVRRVE